ncbi:hypothetical protein HK098_001843 [Nowakowskiella sp. JEL0407]|nr:hypothetical protein HK098_001843 [Nowakowskiella sp. JEL0407]
MSVFVIALILFHILYSNALSIPPVAPLESRLQPRAPTADPIPDLTLDQTALMLKLLNDIRRAYGAAPLRIDTRFTTVAQEQATFQANNCMLTHTGLYGQALADRVKRITLLSNLYLGENVAAGQQTVDQAVYAWRMSSGHMRNMINPNYNVVGFGYAYNPNCLYKRTPAPELSSSETSTMLTLLNNLRAQNGAAAVRIDTRFTAVAQSQSNFQASKCTMTHVGANGATLGTRVKSITSLSNLALGENVAAGYQTVQAVFEGWKNSPGHFANMINKDYNVVGFGLAVNSGCTNYQKYWTQDFAKVSPVSSSAVKSPSLSSANVATRLGDWSFCSSSAQCKNGCCSKQYSNDGKLKCTPGGSICT